MHTDEEIQDINTVDAEFEIIDKKVEREINQNANSEVMEMPAQEEALESAAKEPVKATPDQAFDVEQDPAEGAQLFNEEKPKPKF